MYNVDALLYHLGTYILMLSKTGFKLYIEMYFIGHREVDIK
jgi:hypothetical protein